VTRFHVGEIQRSALAMYVFDPAHEPIFDDDTPFPGRLEGATLEVDDLRAAASWLTDAANSADADNDAEFRDALTAIARRVGRAAYPKRVKETP